MVYIEINKKNYESGKTNLIDQLNSYLTRKDSKIFILFYMEGCGPCNATRPEWSKLKNILSNDILNSKNVVIVSIDKDLSGKLKNIGKEPNSFPTIRYITNEGKINENYEDSNISLKDRTIDSFVEWINVKTGENYITNSEKKGGTRKKRTKKWSTKYKKSIKCNRPRGFSQKQYCKYGRKKYR
jgi:thiol-disulfide isomerase/thioredoxin